MIKAHYSIDKIDKLMNKKLKKILHLKSQDIFSIKIDRSDASRCVITVAYKQNK